jgi:hypothetical protein
MDAALGALATAPVDPAAREALAELAAAVSHRAG